MLKLATANTWDDILAMVENAAKAAKPGQWIYGRGWHQEKWTTPPSPNVEGFPTEASLSRVSPNNPVLLTHASGHASFANALAMKLSGVTRTTKNPDGGEILKDAKGNPTGLLRETAAGLIKRGTGEPAPTDDERVARERRVLELAAQEALSKGITSFQDAGIVVRDHRSHEGDGRRGQARRPALGHGARGPRAGGAEAGAVPDDRLRQRSSDRARHQAFDRRRARIARRVAARAVRRQARQRRPEHDAGRRHSRDRRSWRCSTAISSACTPSATAPTARRSNIFEEAFKANPDKKDLRWRVEHAQHLHPSDIPRFGALGVIASMEGVHCTSDAPYVLGAARRRSAPKRAPTSGRS